MQENHHLDQPQNLNYNQNTTASILINPTSQISAFQIPMIQTFNPTEQNQQIQPNQEQNQLNQAINQSLNQYQTQNLSRKNGLRKRYYKMIKKMKVGKTNQKCTICIQQFKKDQVINLLPCGHIIHSTCCKNWFSFNQKCPVCRFNLAEYFESIQISQMEPKMIIQSEQILENAIERLEQSIQSV